MSDIEKGATLSLDINKLVDDFTTAGDSFDINMLAGRAFDTSSLDVRFSDPARIVINAILAPTTMDVVNFCFPVLHMFWIRSS